MQVGASTSPHLWSPEGSSLNHNHGVGGVYEESESDVGRSESDIGSHEGGESEVEQDCSVAMALLALGGE